MMYHILPLCLWGNPVWPLILSRFMAMGGYLGMANQILWALSGWQRQRLKQKDWRHRCSFKWKEHRWPSELRAALAEEVGPESYSFGLSVARTLTPGLGRGFDSCLRIRAQVGQHLDSSFGRPWVRTQWSQPGLTAAYRTEIRTGRCLKLLYLWWFVGLQ